MSYLLAVNVQTVSLIFAAQFLADYLASNVDGEFNWTPIVWVGAIVVIFYSWYVFFRFIILQEKRHNKPGEEKEE